MGEPMLGGRYRAERVLGRGGMGTVWQAVDTVLDRPVAVKVVDGSALADPATRERFRREALAVARLAHPRIAAVHDYSEGESSAFLVMELLDGETVTERLARDGRIPPAEAAEVAARAAEALDAAHRAGVLHRDVKPGNIMLTTHGVKVLDFGIATSPNETSLTGPHRVVGTPAYLSPERVNGAPASEAGDLYALGVVLYEMLAGRPPFEGNHPVALLAAHTTRPPDPLPPDVPPALAGICMALLAKNPADRPHPAIAVADKLRAAVTAGYGEDSPHHGVDFPPRTPSRRTRGRLVLAAAAVVVALALAAFLWPRSSGGGPAAPRDRAATTRAPDPKTGLPGAVPPALEALKGLISVGRATGQISAQEAERLNRKVGEAGSELSKNHPEQARRRLTELANNISDEKGISATEADAVSGAVRRLAALIPG